MEVLNFTINYFLTKDLFMLTAFICYPPAQTAQLWRGASDVGIRLTVYPDLTHPLVFTPHTRHREAILLDLECPGARYILRKESGAVIINVSKSGKLSYIFGKVISDGIKWMPRGWKYVTDEAGQASSYRFFNYRYSWLLIHNSSYNRSLIEDTLEDYEILPDSDVVWCSSDHLVEVYRVKAKQPYLLNDLGLNHKCTKQELIALWGGLPSTVTRRKDLRSARIVGASLISQPQYFRGWHDVSNRQIDTFPKLTYPLVWLLAEDLHFHLTLRQVDLYGVLYPNGSFDGLAGLLQRNEVEIGVASIFMRQDRMAVLHFLSETLALTGAFIFRQPPRSVVSNVFLAPFSSGVWLASALVSLLASVLLALLKTVREATHTHSRQLLSPLTFPDTCTFALGTICQQGFHLTPAVTSVRVVMFSTLFSSLFLFTAYSAKIVTLLQTPSDALRTIDDLGRSPMTLGVQETTYKKVYFIEAADAATQRLYKRKILPQGNKAYLSVVDGIARVRTGLFAFQVERSSGYDVITKTFTEREKCSLDEIEAFKLPTVCIPLRKFSGYRELFAVRLRWQRETGLMGRARRVWLAGRPPCDSPAQGFVSIGLRDVLPALQVFLLGALLSMVILGIELLVHSRKGKPAPCCFPRHNPVTTSTAVRTC